MNITRGIQLGLMLSGFLLLHNFYLALTALIEARSSKSSFTASLGVIDVFREDSSKLSQGGTFATIYNTYVPYDPKGSFLTNRKGETVEVVCNSRQVYTEVPIESWGLDRIIWASVIAMAVFAAAFIWIVYQAFQFSRAAQKNEFFLWKNFRRIRTIGIVITTFGVIDYLRLINMDIIGKWLLGYSGLMPGGKFTMGLLPLWFITGGLLLLIADGFKHGFDLQRKENASI